VGLAGSRASALVPGCSTKQKEKNEKNAVALHACTVGEHIVRNQL
jgi:hypothetical protein